MFTLLFFFFFFCFFGLYLVVFLLLYVMVVGIFMYLYIKFWLAMLIFLIYVSGLLILLFYVFSCSSKLLGSNYLSVFPLFSFFFLGFKFFMDTVDFEVMFGLFKKQMFTFSVFMVVFLLIFFLIMSKIKLFNLGTFRLFY